MRTFTEFAAPTEDFISDNLISNETSYLDVAGALAQHRGGVYLGVGPEQNFSYIALARPELALIVDLRRDNALLHLLYKAIFSRARDRTEFLCLLVGRSCARDVAPAADASIEAVLDCVAKAPRDRSQFERDHRVLADDSRVRPELRLSDADFKAMQRMHHQFFERGLDIRFELKSKNGRNYPTLAELLRAHSPDGKYGSFLADESGFGFVRELERQDRVQFAVGDFGKPETLGRIAGELRRRGLVLRTFYTSNVEQYLFGSPAWMAWQANLSAFPIDGESNLLRAYLDQGQRHPLQRHGQRTASFMTPIGAWLECERLKPSKSYFATITRPECGNSSAVRVQADR
ncbi:MAG TPA: hypothetical protein VFQ35_18715 [Polyangiaceae bacterium]|nr:hypothetical protein [Polyangiaceae bacterium]